MEPIISEPLLKMKKSLSRKKSSIMERYYLFDILIFHIFKKSFTLFYFSKVIGVIIAKTHEQALYAARKVSIVYEDLPHIVSIEEAISAVTIYWRTQLSSVLLEMN